MDNITYQINEPVLLNYTEDDLYPEDLGFSGIVLESPFENFKFFLNDTFYYFGTIKENEEWCIIYRENSKGKRVREYAVLKSMIKKHPKFEQIGNQFYEI